MLTRSCRVGFVSSRVFFVAAASLTTHMSAAGASSGAAAARSQLTQLASNSSAAWSFRAARLPLATQSVLTRGKRRRRTGGGAYYRHDGVRITHNPYAPDMAAKYGEPGETDGEGFDPYADSVGAGIYSGTVSRREQDGSVVVGKQYQNHNPRPGPVYSGGGYTPVSRAIATFRSQVDGGAAASSTALAKLLDQHPDLVNDVSTGGALPLHTCGMSRENQHATAFLISRGADVEALDTYGYTPLDRMASNNLAVGAKALLEAGADPHPAGAGDPMRVAKQSEAAGVIEVLAEHAKSHGKGRAGGRTVEAISVFSATHPEIVGRYTQRDGSGSDIPTGFAEVCEQNSWDTASTWQRLNGGENGAWFGHEENASYIYFNKLDGMWWIDGPDGLGVYKAEAPSWAPPGGSIRWQALDGGTHRPTLAIYRTLK